MLKVGLTGNMGSGKSLVAVIFGILGVPLYPSDDASKRFLSDPRIVKSVRNAFGDGIMSPSGKIDRITLGSLVFSNPEKLSFLNRLLHPLVMEDFREWCGKHTTHPYIILESAILFETGLNREFDQVIHVSCPQEVAIDRVIRRDGMQRAEILKRMRFQMEDHEKATASDFVVRNDGSELVIPQVLRIHQFLSEGRA